KVRVRGGELTWQAEADLESGLAGFTIERDGEFLANVPEKAARNPFGRPIFQGLQYSDTPTQPLVPMRFTDAKAEAGKKHTYRVIAVNTAGLKSKPSAEATPAAAQAERKTWAERLGWPPGKRVLILHADDVGMCYEANASAQRALGRGEYRSASVMVP